MKEPRIFHIWLWRFFAKLTVYNSENQSWSAGITIHLTNALYFQVSLINVNLRAGVILHQPRGINENPKAT